jgi:hypothetical protein
LRFKAIYANRPSGDKGPESKHKPVFTLVFGNIQAFFARPFAALQQGLAALRARFSITRPTPDVRVLAQAARTRNANPSGRQTAPAHFAAFADGSGHATASETMRHRANWAENGSLFSHLQNRHLALE